nr:bzip-type transcription factor mbz1 [Quercus suber]
MQKTANTQVMQQRQLILQARHAQYCQLGNGTQPPASSQPGSHNRPKRASHVSEAHVEGSISRLLNQIRQDSATGDQDGDSNDDLSQLARMKSDEDEMSEDERLLASEEGEKLSSKERRQLRNKVSARAFRSRRKGRFDRLSLGSSSLTILPEYIGQLESHVDGLPHRKRGSRPYSKSAPLSRSHSPESAGQPRLASLLARPPEAMISRPLLKGPHPSTRPPSTSYRAPPEPHPPPAASNQANEEWTPLFSPDHVEGRHKFSSPSPAYQQHKQQVRLPSGSTVNLLLQQSRYEWYGSGIGNVGFDTAMSGWSSSIDPEPDMMVDFN